jgi:hypothetical protein
VKQIGKYTYEVDSNNILRAWDTENLNPDNAPFLYQPEHPDGTAWASAQEAEDWVVNLINGWSIPKTDTPAE